ncbi:MAG: twin-arginine translocation signal domain-containing protein, partial [Bradyrhizobium sp.]|uniref:twin-arginine translocation signal domain-containing protein n=1 Tax=Bradyrhizobium sp. TaxID=376 RepID=UPI001E03736D
MDRRQFLATAGSAAAAAGIASPAVALVQVRTKVRVGYLHTIAVDEQLWLCDHIGAWARNGLDPQFKLYGTGIELFKAMAAGDIDMLVTGAVC